MNTDSTAADMNPRKLKHDFLNDISSLKMNVEALQLMREEPEEFDELISLMRGTIQLFEDRLDSVLSLRSDGGG